MGEVARGDDCSTVIDGAVGGSVGRSGDFSPTEFDDGSVLITEAGSDLTIDSGAGTKSVLLSTPPVSPGCGRLRVGLEVDVGVDGRLK